MERGLGHDFAAVRIHADDSGSQARALGARAVTLGQDIHFAPGMYAPGTAAGQRRIAHELAHVIQQGGQAPSGGTPDRGGEREAHAAADQVAAAGRADVAPHAVSGPQLDDGTTPPQTPTKEEDAVVGGLKTVGAEMLKNEKVKKELVEPVTDAVGTRATREWGSLSTGEKAGLITFGAGTVVMSGGALLSGSPGRMSGVNLAAPVGLLPYGTLETFIYTMPDAKSPRWKFETGFDLSDVLKLGGDKLGWKGLSLSADLKWDYDPTSRSLRLTGGTGRLGLFPGLSVEGGTYPGRLKEPTLFPTDTGFAESRQSLPEGPKLPGTPDVRVMVTFDVMKFAASGVIPGLSEAFGLSRRKK